MGFLDKFKRKKAVLVQQERPVLRSQPSREQAQVNFQVPVRPASPRPVLSQSDAPRTIAKRKKVKKRRVMKKKAKRKGKKARKPSQPRSFKVENETSSKKWLQKDKELLGGALRDLNRELQSLRNARKRLESKMDGFSSQLGDTQDKEISLRNKISELMKKEATINKKKTTAKDKLAILDQKIEKVKVIQSELKNI